MYDSGVHRYDGKLGVPLIYLGMCDKLGQTFTSSSTLKSQLL